MTKPSPNLIRLVTWTHSPVAKDLIDIVASLTDDDLYTAMTNMRGTAAGRIAWAEWGRRGGYIDLKLQVTELKGKLVVAYEGDAKPITEVPILDQKS